MARFCIILACSLLLVAGAHASCFRVRMSCEPGPFYGDIPNTPTTCIDCSCNDEGTQVGCCSRVAFPAGYDRAKCVAIFDEDNCRYNVVREKNPKRKCPVTAWNG